MTRRKLNLAYIDNDTMRKATFKKRMKGIMKKIHELSVLCDIKACVIINSSFSPTPEVWPSVSGVKNVVERFQMLPEVDQLKKMVNHATFLKQSIDKTMENNNKREKDNEERTMREAMLWFLEGRGDRLMLTDQNRLDLIQFLNQHLRRLYHHREQTLNQPRLEHGESSSAVNIMAPKATIEVDSSSFSAANVMTSRATTEMGSSSLAPRAIVEVGSSLFSSGNLMAPRAIAGEGSFYLGPRAMPEVGSSAFQNLDGLNSPPLASDLWATRFINSSDKIYEQVNTFANIFPPTSNDPLGYYLMMNQVGVYDQNPNFIPNLHQYQYQQQFGFPPVMGQDGMYHMNQDPNHQRFGYPPVLGQDGMYNPSQSHNQQEEQLVDMTFNNPEQMGFHRWCMS